MKRIPQAGQALLYLCHAVLAAQRRRDSAGQQGRRAVARRVRRGMQPAQPGSAAGTPAVRSRSAAPRAAPGGGRRGGRHGRPLPAGAPAAPWPGGRGLLWQQGLAHARAPRARRLLRPGRLGQRGEHGGHALVHVQQLVAQRLAQELE